MGKGVIIMVYFYLGLLLFVDGVIMSIVGVISYSNALSIGYARFDISGAILAAIGAVALIVGVVIWIVGYAKKERG